MCNPENLRRLTTHKALLRLRPRTQWLNDPSSGDSPQLLETLNRIIVAHNKNELNGTSFVAR